MIQLQQIQNNTKNSVFLFLSFLLQLVPVTAYLTVPVLELSCDTVDFKTCFVAQTKTEHVFLSNRGGCRSYWTALLGIWVLQLGFLALQFHCLFFFWCFGFVKTACIHSYDDVQSKHTRPASVPTYVWWWWLLVFVFMYISVSLLVSAFTPDLTKG